MAPQKTTLQEFEAIFPKLQQALLDDARALKLPQGEHSWYSKVCAIFAPLPPLSLTLTLTLSVWLTFFCIGSPSTGMDLNGSNTRIRT